MVYSLYGVLLIYTLFELPSDLNRPSLQHRFILFILESNKGDFGGDFLSFDTNSLAFEVTLVFDTCY